MKLPHFMLKHNSSIADVTIKTVNNMIGTWKSDSENFHKRCKSFRAFVPWGPELSGKAGFVD
jgi:hypothetical protein|tara:strand:+ start:91 stop:276 length:186 start_codon:yes stop_codon:yes gene_type:complete